jgi:5-methylthioadenosine/S-adenosylhomocysteine deaminase
LLKDVLLDGKKCNILISGNRIEKIESAAEGALLQIAAERSAQVEDCSGLTVMPGLVNMHTHAGMSMMRGIGEDISFHEWLDRIWEVEKDLTEEYVYTATKLACLEMIKTGTTTFNDQYWYMPMAYKAASELGLRSVLSYVVCDRNDPEESERQKTQCREIYEFTKSWADTSTFIVSIHAIYSVSEPMMLWARDFARENGLKMPVTVRFTFKSSTGSSDHCQKGFFSNTLISLPSASPSGKSVFAISSDITTLFFDDNALPGSPSSNANVKKSKKVSDAPRILAFIFVSP